VHRGPRKLSRRATRRLRCLRRQPLPAAAGENFRYWEANARAKAPRQASLAEDQGEIRTGRFDVNLG